jgi:hypothetical protein
MDFISEGLSGLLGFWRGLGRFIEDYWFIGVIYVKVYRNLSISDYRRFLNAGFLEFFT